ncbi:hypothetical protein MPTK2_3g05670 [Marchantia polymorpha subsp. ruderalis]
MQIACNCCEDCIRIRVTDASARSNITSVDIIRAGEDSLAFKSSSAKTVGVRGRSSMGGGMFGDGRISRAEAWKSRARFALARACNGSGRAPETRLASQHRRCTTRRGCVSGCGVSSRPVPSLACGRNPMEAMTNPTTAIISIIAPALAHETLRCTRASRAQSPDGMSPAKNMQGTSRPRGSSMSERPSQAGCDLGEASATRECAGFGACERARCIHGCQTPPKSRATVASARARSCFSSRRGNHTRACARAIIYNSGRSSSSSSSGEDETESGGGRARIRKRCAAR